MGFLGNLFGNSDYTDERITKDEKIKRLENQVKNLETYARSLRQRIREEEANQIADEKIDQIYSRIDEVELQRQATELTIKHELELAAAKADLEKKILDIRVKSTELVESIKADANRRIEEAESTIDEIVRDEVAESEARREAAEVKAAKFEAESKSKDTVIATLKENLKMFAELQKGIIGALPNVDLQKLNFNVDVRGNSK